MKIKHLGFVLGTAATGVAIFVGVGSALVSASTLTSGTTTRNSIARYTIKEDRLTAEAEVLNTTPTQLENQLKTETMQQIVTAAGLTKTTFREKVATKLRTDLANQGYSQTQINNALKHHKKK